MPVILLWICFLDESIPKYRERVNHGYNSMVLNSIQYHEKVSKLLRIWQQDVVRETQEFGQYFDRSGLFFGSIIGTIASFDLFPYVSSHSFFYTRNDDNFSLFCFFQHLQQLSPSMAIHDWIYQIFSKVDVYFGYNGKITQLSLVQGHELFILFV